jgi:hypothetical protein
MAYRADNDMAVYPIIVKAACIAKVGLDRSSFVSGFQDMLNVETSSKMNAKNKINIPDPRFFNLNSMIM